MFKIFKIFLFPIIIFNSSCLSAQEMSDYILKVRAGQYPPYYNFNTDLEKWEGMVIEVMDAVASKAGFKVDYRDISRKRAFFQLKSGDLDLMLNLTRTPEREEFLDFIGLCSFEKMTLVVNKNDKDISVNNVNDFLEFSRPLAVRENYYYPLLSDYIEYDERFRRSILVIKTNHESTIPKILKIGRAIGYFEDYMTVKVAIEHEPGYDDLILHHFSLNDPQPVYIAASLKLNGKIRAKLKTAHQELMRNGLIISILEKWGNPIVTDYGIE